MRATRHTPALLIGVELLVVLNALAGGVYGLSGAPGVPRAVELSVGAGLLLIGWIVVEMLIIPISWLQPAFLALGALVVVPGLQLRRID
jgi:hypothetical protein